MKFKVPFTFSSIEILKRRSKSFIKFTSSKESKLDKYLKNSEEQITRRQYLSICYRLFLINTIFLSVILSSILIILRGDYFYTYVGSGSAVLISGFILFNQINYPRIFSMHKSKDVDKNLISALQDMIVQLDSGVPIFQILVNIANSDYGEVSKEFEKITKEINSGVPQIEAIENHGKINTSEYFRRVLWQISNGMRSGGDIGIVIKESIKNLSAEQAIQIQSYGNKLNPIIMFYMLIAVILPALGITFMIIISSMLGLSSKIIQAVFIFIFVFVVFMQIMFLGVIKSKRPTLL